MGALVGTAGTMLGTVGTLGQRWGLGQWWGRWWWAQLCGDSGNVVGTVGQWDSGGDSDGGDS
eukprot:5592893-Pyramimonas_sp.AAC.1